MYQYEKSLFNCIRKTYILKDKSKIILKNTMYITHTERNHDEHVSLEC